MRTYAGWTLLLSVAMLWGCSKTVLVPVPPRMDLKSYGTLGIVEFGSNSESAANVQATRKFQEQVQAAQPGTPFLELGKREALLAEVGSRQLDGDALRKIGAKYGVAAIFVGDIVYSEPKTDVKITDLAKLDGGVRTEVRGDISSRLIETRTGASVWSSSAWARQAARPAQRVGGARRERRGEEVESPRGDGPGPGLPAHARLSANLGAAAREIGLSNGYPINQRKARRRRPGSRSHRRGGSIAVPHRELPDLDDSGLSVSLSGAPHH